MRSSGTRLRAEIARPSPRPRGSDDPQYSPDSAGQAVGEPGLLQGLRRRRPADARCLLDETLPVTIATYAKSVCHSGPGGYALLSAILAAGSVSGALISDGSPGRVGVYLLVFTGGAAIGGPLLGPVDQRLGPRAGLLLAGALPALVTALIALRLARRRRDGLRVICPEQAPRQILRPGG